MFSKIRSFGLFALLTSVALPTFADTTNYPYYTGFGAFATKMDINTTQDMRGRVEAFITLVDRNAELQGQERITWNDAGTGYQIFIGVSASDNWDWEAGFIRLGESSANIRSRVNSSDFDIADVSTRSEVDGWFGLVQYSPEFFDGFDGMIRFGYMSWNGTEKSYFTTENDPVTPRTGQSTIKGVDEFYGLGASYVLTERWTIRADVNRYILGTDEADIFGLTALLKF